MWMNPPSVYDVATPSIHRTNSTTKIVHNMGMSPSTVCFGAASHVGHFIDNCVQAVVDAIDCVADA